MRLNQYSDIDRALLSMLAMLTNGKRLKSGPLEMLACRGWVNIERHCDTGRYVWALTPGGKRELDMYHRIRDRETTDGGDSSGAMGASPEQ